MQKAVFIKVDDYYEPDLDELNSYLEKGATVISNSGFLYGGSVHGSGYPKGIIYVLDIPDTKKVED